MTASDLIGNAAYHTFNGPVRVATYRFTPPGGTWDGHDDGIYQSIVVFGQVKDSSGNVVPANVFGHFKVSIP